MNKIIAKWSLMAALCVSLMFASLGLLAEERDTWKINMKEADIRNFIEQISDITGYSFVVDMRVKGKVTVVSHADMTADEIFAMFQSVLRVHGYASIKSGAIYKIVPTQGAKQDNLPLWADGDVSERMITRVIPVKNTNAVELVPILRPMVPQYGHLAAVTSANALIISDHASNIERIVNIVRRIDSSESEEIEVVQLTHAWVTDVVKLLEELTPVQTGSKKKSGRGAARVRVVAEERTNRLILRGEKSARARVKGLIKELDQPVESTGSTQVIYLRHANATKIAEILRGIISGKPVSLSKSTPSTNRGRASSSRSSRSTGSGGSSNGVTIQPDDSLNALVIRAAPSDMAEIRNIIDQLDIRRAQVLIEAAIVEITGTMGKGVGIQWGAADDSSLIGGVNFGNVGNSLSSLIAASNGGAGAATSLANGITLGTGKVNDEGDVEFAMILQAIASATNTNLLSTPSIMTLDNEEASIIVGSNVPFVTGSQLSSGGDNPFQTVERKDVGLTLKVTPQVNAGNTIRLVVEQETSNVTSTAEAIQATDVVTDKRAIKTTVLANDGQIIVLGGLMKDDVEISESKVPLLGDIPLLGVLFRSTQRKHVKRNLVVMLRPTIIRNAESADKVSERYYQRMRTVQLELDDIGNLYATGEDIYPGDAKTLIETGLKKRASRVEY